MEVGDLRTAISRRLGQEIGGRWSDLTVESYVETFDGLADVVLGVIRETACVVERGDLRQLLVWLHLIERDEMDFPLTDDELAMLDRLRASLGES